MTSKVPKGLATWAGVVAAIGQFLAAVAVWLTADDLLSLAALGPLATAAYTLAKVIEGRMAQAQALAAADAARNLKAASVASAQSKAGALAQGLENAYRASTFTAPRPGLETETVERDPAEGCTSTFEERS